MRPSQRSSAARFVPTVTGSKLNYGTGTPPDVPDERAKRLRQSLKEHDAKDGAERRTKTRQEKGQQLWVIAPKGLSLHHQSHME